MRSFYRRTSAPDPVTGDRPGLIHVPALAVELGGTQRFIRWPVAEDRVPFLKIGKFVRFDSREIGCPVALTNQDAFEHLPNALRSGEVAIVTSGSQLIALIQERAWACPVCIQPVLSTRPYETWPPEDLRALQPPYEDSLGRPSHEVCPSCGFEFGNDDNPGTAPADLRRE